MGFRALQDAAAFFVEVSCLGSIRICVHIQARLTQVRRESSMRLPKPGQDRFGVKVEGLRFRVYPTSCQGRYDFSLKGSQFGFTAWAFRPYLGCP